MDKVTDPGVDERGMGTGGMRGDWKRAGTGKDGIAASPETTETGTEGLTGDLCLCHRSPVNPQEPRPHQIANSV